MARGWALSWLLASRRHDRAAILYLCRLCTSSICQILSWKCSIRAFWHCPVSVLNCMTLSEGLPHSLVNKSEQPRASFAMEDHLIP